jgi:hypothetical protein
MKVIDYLRRTLLLIACLSIFAAACAYSKPQAPLSVTETLVPQPSTALTVTIEIKETQVPQTETKTPSPQP